MLSFFIKLTQSSLWKCGKVVFTWTLWKTQNFKHLFLYFFLFIYFSFYCFFIKVKDIIKLPVRACACVMQVKSTVYHSFIYLSFLYSLCSLFLSFIFLSFVLFFLLFLFSLSKQVNLFSISLSIKVYLFVRMRVCVRKCSKVVNTIQKSCLKVHASTKKCKNMAKSAKNYQISKTVIAQIVLICV